MYKNKKYVWHDFNSVDTSDLESFLHYNDNHEKKETLKKSCIINEI